MKQSKSKVQPIKYVSTNRGEIWSTLGTGRISPRARGIIISFLMKIEDSSGPKAVVDYLRRVKSTILDIHEGKTLIELRQLHNRSRLFTGPFLPIFNLSLKRKGLERAINLLNISGLFEREAPTLRDYRQHASSLEKIIDQHTPENSLDPDESITECLKFEATPKDQTIALGLPWKVTDHEYPSSRKGSPTVNNKTIRLIEGSPEEHARSILLYPRAALEHYDYFLHLIGEQLCPDRTELELAIENTKADYAGRAVGLTKDRHLKLRFIYNANFILQTALEPLHLFLKEYLKRDSNCYCFNQREGALWVERFYIENPGKRLTSLDLQAASDNIPFSAQFLFLESLVPKYLPWRSDVLGLLCKAVRMRWFFPPHLDPLETQYIQFLSGTPMGLKACYYLFTSWLIRVFRFYGLKDFAVIGDDLVFESHLTEVIISVFDYFSIPISLHKSLLDRLTAEIAGRIVKHDLGILNTAKAKTAQGSNPVPTLCRLGARSFKCFSEFKRFSDKKQKNLLALAESRVGQYESQVSELVCNSNTSEPASGGYTIYQLYSMGLITEEEKYALLNLLTLQLQFPSSCLEDLLERPFSYRKREIDRVLLERKGKIRMIEVLYEFPSIINYIPLVRALQSQIEVLCREHDRDLRMRLESRSTLYVICLASAGGVPGNFPALEKILESFHSPLGEQLGSVESCLRFLQSEIERSQVPQLCQIKPKFRRFGQRADVVFLKHLSDQFEKTDRGKLIAPLYTKFSKERLEGILEGRLSDEDYYLTIKHPHSSAPSLGHYNYFLTGSFHRPSSGSSLLSGLPDSTVNNKATVDYFLDNLDYSDEDEEFERSEQDLLESSNQIGEKTIMVENEVKRFFTLSYLLPDFCLDFLSNLVLKLKEIRFIPPIGKRSK